MDPLELDAGLFLEQAIFVTLFIGFPIISLIDLAKKQFSSTPLAVWVVVICAVPLLGSLAYWVVTPTAENRI